MTTIDWYFDIISPYAALAWPDVEALATTHTVRLKPVLFAGLLGHWGQLGPAEIPAKRIHTYRQAVWLAAQRGIHLHGPDAHPFNPLAWLRLLCALGPTPAAISKVFDAIWITGGDPMDMAYVRETAHQLGVEDADALVASDTAKQALRDNTNAAIAAGVFGVPTLVIDRQIFWGLDAMAMARDYLANPSLFDSDIMRRATMLPIGIERRR